MQLIVATPLHMTYGIGEESIAQYLIEHGADQDIAMVENLWIINSVRILQIVMLIFHNSLLKNDKYYVQIF